MNKLLLVSMSIFAAACAQDGRDTITGVRADGVTVVCEPTGSGGGDDDGYECTPSDGDETCEGYAEGGTALVLWPPNHKLHTISLAECAAVSDCPAGITSSTSTGHITAVTADEAIDVGRGGDGSTKDYDMKIVDAATVEIRSERQGGGDGRVYRVHFEDAAGVAGSCEIHVPHDRGPIGGAIDSGEVVRATSP